MRNFLFLQGTRFARIVRKLDEYLDVDNPLVFLPRTAVVSATDDDIVGKFTGRVFAADIIGDDSKALTYEAGQLEFVRSGIVNLKVGSHLTGSLLRKFYELSQGVGLPDDTELFGDSLRVVATSLLKGVRQRADSMIAGLYLDTYAYNRLGVRLEGTFGTPQDLKVEVDVPWTDTENSTPVQDIHQIVKHAQDTYGENYNTLILPADDLDLIIRSDEYQDLWKGVHNYYDVSAKISEFDPRLSNDLGRILGVSQIIKSDAHFRERHSDGSIATTRVHPLGKVIVCDSSDFNNPGAFDWANGVVAESLVAGLVPGVVAGLSGATRGPVGYLATPNTDLNPPGILAFAVQRGFPRKHRETMNAVLTVREA